MINFALWTSRANRKTNLVEYFLTSDRFEIAAAAERMRVDRNGSLVSMLLIRLSPKSSTPEELAKLQTFVAERLRLTDTVGWLQDGRLGILLPDTDPSGAWKVAADLCEFFPAGETRPDCEVVVYPDRTSGPSSSDDQPQDGKLIAKTEDVIINNQAGATQGNLNGISHFESLTLSKMPVWKRVLDITGASLGIVALSPVIATAAVAIQFTSPGGAFFLQEREGFGGRRFKMYKLRTMVNNAEKLKSKLRHKSEQDGPAFKMESDPRITLIGRILRKTSIDELPQLFNVLRGDMSLVGPRPLPVDESLACKPWQRKRLSVTPGVTCIWQIYGRNSVPFDDWIRMDLEYASKRSLWLDLKLVAITAPSLIRTKGR